MPLFVGMPWRDQYGWKPHIMREHKEYTYPLREIVDPRELVTHGGFRRHRADLGALPVHVNPNLPTNSTDQGAFAITLGEEIVDDDGSYRVTPQELYVILAHETGHLLQRMEHRQGRLIRQRPKSRVMEDEYIHADEAVEQDALFWDAMQGTKFGWGREEFGRYSRRFWALAYEPTEVNEEARAEMLGERMAAMTVMSRRPVHVSRHRRRS